jgi:hypothetical protein
LLNGTPPFPELLAICVLPRRDIKDNVQELASFIRRHSLCWLLFVDDKIIEVLAISGVNQSPLRVVTSFGELKAKRGSL